MFRYILNQPGEQCTQTPLEIYNRCMSYLKTVYIPLLRCQEPYNRSEFIPNLLQEYYSYKVPENWNIDYAEKFGKTNDELLRFMRVVFLGKPSLYPYGEELHQIFTSNKWQTLIEVDKYFIPEPGQVEGRNFFLKIIGTNFTVWADLIDKLIAGGGRVYLYIYIYPKLKNFAKEFRRFLYERLITNHRVGIEEVTYSYQLYLHYQYILTGHIQDGGQFNEHIQSLIDGTINVLKVNTAYIQKAGKVNCTEPLLSPVFNSTGKLQECRYLGTPGDKDKHCYGCNDPFIFQDELLIRG